MVGLVHHMAGHQQRGAATGQGVELRPQVGAQHRVQADRPLVENQEVGLADQGAGQRHPGALAAGQVAAVSAGLVAQADPVDGLVGGAGIDPVQSGEVPHVVDDA